MTTPLTRDAVKAMLDECGNPDCLTCEYAAALLAAWDERDGLRKEFAAVVAMLSEMHGAEYSRADTAEAKLAEWQASQGYAYIGRDWKTVLARDLEDRAETAEAKLAERDAENARLREVCCDAIRWVSRYRWASPWCDAMRSAIGDDARALLNKEPKP